MWQKFTERARRVILLGQQEEANRMKSGYVGTEHILLGLLSESEGVASQILQQMGVSLIKVREQIEGAIENDVEEFVYKEPKLTPKARRVLELGADEARRMRHGYIGTEHLLLALLREKDGLAAKTLRSMGLNLDKVRTQVMEHLGSDPVSLRDTRSVTATYQRLHLERAILNDAQKWAIDNDDQELASLLNNAVERVTKQIAEHNNKTENSEGV